MTAARRHRCASVLRAGGVGRLLGPVGACGVAGLVLVRLPGGSAVLPVGDRFHLAVLLAAAATAPAVLEPAGPVADASPSSRLLRRSRRVLAAGAAALAVVTVTSVLAPASGRPPAATTMAQLAAHVALCAGVAAAVARTCPERSAVTAGAATTALAGVGPTMAGVAQWSLDAGSADVGRLLVVAAVAAVGFAVASRDPAVRRAWSGH